VLRIVLKREILHNLYSLRFLISLAIVLAAFSAGALSYIPGHAGEVRNDGEVRRQELGRMRAQAEANASELAVGRRIYTLKPRDNAFITDARERYLPNAFEYSAWNVFSFRASGGTANPFLKNSDALSWSFIVSLIVSFIALLFTFDAVSGEKEAKTLALALSNSLSRGSLLFGKLLSAVISVMALVTIGALVSLLIILVARGVSLSGSLAGEVAGFLAAAALLVLTFAALGLLSSVIARTSNVSLLLALSFWLVFTVVIPNSSLFVARTLFPIESSESVQKRVDAAFADLDKSAPPGSWSMDTGVPFLPEHELRANLQRKRLAAEKAIRDAYAQTVFRQLERTRLVGSLSPAAVFQYLTEAAAGAGYVRFRKVWSDLHVYQARFLEFFRTLDARDADSPHWFNPFEWVSTTRKPVDFSLVPRFEERPMSPGDRIAPALPYLGLGVFYVCAVFLVSFILFIRYDVR
jgi:ABC-type transport system involved in multi-copper enzyme maturation permease subunit